MAIDRQRGVDVGWIGRDSGPEDGFVDALLYDV